MNSLWVQHDNMDMNTSQSASHSQSPSPISIRPSLPSTCSSKKKRRTSRNSDRIAHPALPLASPVFPINIHTSAQSSGAVIAQQDVLTGSVTQRILEALAKFQTCIFLLTNTILELSESFKATLPEHNSTMIVERLSQSIAAIEKCNSKGPVENGGGRSVETRVAVDTQDDTPAGSLDTTTSSEAAPAVPCCKNSIVMIKKKPHKIWSYISKYIGLLLALCASLCMSLVTLVVKYMEGYHPVSKVVWRLQGVLWPSLAIVWYHKVYQKKTLFGGLDKKSSSRELWTLAALLVLRGAVGCSADIFQYYSLKFLPLADSTVISFSTPIFVCVVAHYFLGEKCGITPIFTAILTLFGVIVISRPPLLTGEEEMSETLLMGNLYAFLCMTSGTITTILIRYLNDVHFAVTMLALGVCGTVEGLVVSLFTSPFEYPSWNVEDWGLACIIGVLFFCGQLTMTLALQIEEAGVVSLVRTCDVLFSFVFQVMFLQQEANIFSYLGALIVTTGVALTALRKWLMELPEHSLMRQRLFFILR